jgi:hypothetical protein
MIRSRYSTVVLVAVDVDVVIVPVAQHLDVLT